LSLAVTVAMDSVPLARMRVLRAVAEAADPGATVSDAHRALIRGNRWAAIWELDALDAIGLVEVEGPTREEDATATRVYRLADQYRGVYESVGRPHTFPPNREVEDAVPTHTTDGFAYPSGDGNGRVDEDEAARPRLVRHARDPRRNRRGVAG
jgi:hypothetical protein